MDQPLIYSESNHVARLEAEHFFEKHLRTRQLRKNCTVLDVGSGDGSVTKMLTRLLGSFERAVGLDVSEKMVEFARARNADARLEFRLGDVGAVQDIQSFYGVFDYVFSNLCLHCVQDQRQLWRNVYGMLKPSGQVFASFFTDWPMDYVLEAQMANPKWRGYMSKCREVFGPYFRVASPEKVLEKHLVEAGFGVEVCETIDRVAVFPDEETLKNILTAVNPYTAQMPQEALEDYLQDFLEIYKDLDSVKSNSKANQEGRTAPYQLIHVIATKHWM